MLGLYKQWEFVEVKRKEPRYQLTELLIYMQLGMSKAADIYLSRSICFVLINCRLQKEEY